MEPKPPITYNRRSWVVTGCPTVAKWFAIPFTWFTYEDVVRSSFLRVWSWDCRSSIWACETPKKESDNVVHYSWAMMKPKILKNIALNMEL